MSLLLSTDQKIRVRRLLELEEEISEKITGINSQSLYKAKNSPLFSPDNVQNIVHEASGELMKSLLPQYWGQISLKINVAVVLPNKV